MSPAHSGIEEKIQMNDSFQNKVALVTGAGSGMGLITAKAFAAAGAAVALLGDHEDAVRATSIDPKKV